MALRMESYGSAFYRQKSYGSIFKLIKYLGYLTKVPLVVEILGQSVVYLPPSKVMVSNKFFRSAKCERCGRCCSKSFSLAFTSSDIARMEKSVQNHIVSLRQNLKEVLVNLIPKYKKFAYTKPCYLYVNKDRRCNFAHYYPSFGANAEEWVCSIHRVKPIHCLLPLIQINRHGSEEKSSVSLIKRQYGRNWALHCPVKFGPFSTEEFENQDLSILKRLQINAKDLGIATWLDEIVDYLEAHKEEFREGKLPEKPVVIYDGRK